MEAFRGRDDKSGGVEVMFSLGGIVRRKGLTSHWKFRTPALEGRVGDDDMLKAVQGVTGETKTGVRTVPLGNHSMPLYQEDTDSSREERNNQTTARGVTVAQVRSVSEGSSGQPCQVL